MEMIQKWFSDLRSDRTSTDNAERFERSERPKYRKSGKKIHDLMLNEPKVNLEKLAETTKMSNGSLFNNLHVILGMKKLLRFLIVDQKRICITTSKQNLALFTQNLTKF